MKKTSRPDNRPGRMPADIRNAYDLIAAKHDGIVGGPFNTEYERPATLELLGNVSGKRILDAGCGPGSFARQLIDKGATVLALDASSELVKAAKRNLGDSTTVLQADLNQPLDFIESADFDIVLSSLVLDYIRDWDALFGEFHRILKDGGRFVMSIHHPYFLDLKNDPGRIDIEKNYFQVQEVEEDWSPAGIGIPSYRRPLDSISSALWKAGFFIERILEPKPTQAWKEIHAPFYRKWMEHPVIICFSSIKRQFA